MSIESIHELCPTNYRNIPHQELLMYSYLDYIHNRVSSIRGLFKINGFTTIAVTWFRYEVRVILFRRL